MADFSATYRAPSTLRSGVTTDAVRTVQRGHVQGLYYKMWADRDGGGAPVIWTVQGYPDTLGVYAPATIVGGTARVAASSTA